MTYVLIILASFSGVCSRTSSPSPHRPPPPPPPSPPLFPDILFYRLCVVPLYPCCSVKTRFISTWSLPWLPFLVFPLRLLPSCLFVAPLFTVSLQFREARFIAIWTLPRLLFLVFALKPLPSSLIVTPLFRCTFAVP